MSKKVLGLDLGSGNSCVAIMEAGTATVVVNEEGNRTTPSVVQICGEEVKVGNAAKRSMVTKPKNTISFVKRLMGANYTDHDVQKMINTVAYDIIDKSGKPYVKIDNKEYSPEQISSMIVGKMKEVAEAYVGETITDAVITVPAWFGDAARTATKTAGELAGLNVLRVINEPTSAALAANLMEGNKDKTIAVVDSGAGTLDVSVLELSDGMAEVLASNGDTFLGGKDYDDAIVKYICDEFEKENGIDLTKDSMAYARVIEAAEKAKIELSSSKQTDITLPYITMKDGAPVMLTNTLTRAKFDSLVKPLNDRTVEKAKVAIENAGKKYSDIDCILLVGGTTRIPSLQEALKAEFGVELNQSVNPDEAVAIGAVKQADVLAGNSTGEVLLLDVTPLTLGIETKGEVMTKVVEANTTIPCQKKEVFSTAVDNQPEVVINVLQGERAMAKDNKSIGKFKLDGIMPAPAGIPQIEVCFDIDANGIVSVTATDLATKKEQHITIQNDSLSDDEIAKIKADAEKFKEADEKKKKEIEAIDSAERFAFQVEKVLDDKDKQDVVTDEQRTKLTELIKNLKDACFTRELDKIEEAKKALEEVWNPIMKDMYEKAKKEAEDQKSDGTQESETNGTDDTTNPFENVTDNPFAGTETKED
jgi:molecular chaperone DnaK